jgi:hypothetical protein
MLEVFGDQWVKRRVLSRALLANYQISVIADPQISVFTAPRTLKLVNTTADNLNKLGVDSMLFSSINYRLTRVWARAFMKHPSCPQGILYHSRKNPLLLNFAFFGTSEVKNLLAEVDVGPLETISSFNEILDRYEVSLV